MTTLTARTITSLTGCLLLGAALAGSGASATPTPAGTWSGRYSLHGQTAIAFSVQGRRAVVALGIGHADTESVPVSRAGTHIRFALPGRPTPLIFDGRLRGRTVRGTVRQGSVRGTFRVVRGAAPALFARGWFSVGDRTVAVVDDPYGPARLVDLDTGEVHGLYRTGSAFAIGNGFATRTPVRGTLRLGAAGGTVAGVRATRIASRQLEVRFRSGSAMLAGTLTLPASPGRHAAVAFVHGSGPTPRAYLPDLQALLVRNGMAVLAYDKRGIGQSGGRYPGESPTADAIDVLAGDAAAAVRFLSAQPEIDPARVGLAGHSQAGWIMPLAASKERAIREVVVFSGPAVTADENDTYQNLAGSGETPQQLSDADIDAEVLRRGPRRRGSDSVDPAALDTGDLALRRPRQDHSRPALRSPPPADRARARPRLHDRRLPACQPRARGDTDGSHLGDAAFRPLRAGSLPERRVVAAGARAYERLSSGESLVASFELAELRFDHLASSLEKLAHELDWTLVGTRIGLLCGLLPLSGTLATIAFRAYQRSI